MSHLSATAGIITLVGPPHDVGHDYERDNDGIYLRRRLWLNEMAQQRFALLNTTFQTHLPDPSNPDHGDAILSAMFLVRRLVLYEYSRKFSGSEVGWSELVKHVLNILGQPVRLTKFELDWLHKRTFADRGSTTESGSGIFAKPVCLAVCCRTVAQSGKQIVSLLQSRQARNAAAQG